MQCGVWRSSAVYYILLLLHQMIEVHSPLQVVEGGIFFFRESCFRQSGDKQRKSNPTHYRQGRQSVCNMAHCCWR